MEQTEVIQCLVHMNDEDEECELCQREVASIRRQLLEVAEDNSRVEENLKRKFNVSIDMTSIMIMRLNTLIAVVFNGNEKMTLKFENMFLMNCNEALHNAESDAIRSQLTNGINVHPAAFRKGGH